MDDKLPYTTEYLVKLFTIYIKTYEVIPIEKAEKNTPGNIPFIVLFLFGST